MVTSAAHPDYDLRLLGPPTVTVDGRDVSLGGPRQIAVLARLMVTPDQVVSMDQLIASVWDGDEPAQPHVTVRSYISNLRRAIEPNRRRRSADSCLVSIPPGYRLAVDPTVVDWVRFQRLVDEGRAQVIGGNFDVAITVVRRALSLWRGDPCAGLPTSEVFETHRVRLTTLHQTAVELLYESLLHTGQHDAVAAAIEAAIEEDPLRERLTELGMLALYRVGRQSEALALGRRLRERLLDDLGIDPGSAIAEMELRILNHDPVLEPLPGHANPFSAIITGPPADGDAPSPSDPSSPGPSPGPSPGSGPTPSEVAVPVTGLAQPDTVLGRGLATDTLSVGPEPTLSPISAPDPGVAARMVGPLVGRGQVRDRLATMERALSQDRMVAVAVVGEQGIGKTAIVRDAARMLGQTGAEVVWAHSVSDSSAPLWPWTQVVVGLIDGEDGPERELTAGLGALAGLGQSVADLLNGDPAPSAPTAEIILAVTHLLARRARRGPIVVVLEDLHWADRSTVTVLEYAVSTLVDVPVAFISTWRDPENQQGPLAAGLRSLSRLADLSRIDLRPFDVTEVGDLAAAMGRSLTPDQVSSLHRRTAGNPLFVDQLLAEVPAEAVAGPPAPNLRALVTDRVERVHPLAPSVLRAAALFRSPFTAEDLEALHSKGVAAVEAVLAAAVRGHLLDEVDQALGTYRFRHPIVGEVLAADTLSSELRASHRTIGQQLLATDEAEASYHLGWSPDPADRALAARIALDVFHRGTRTVGLPELDARIRNGLTAAELLGRTSETSASDGLVADALGFLSWRARVEDRPSDWADNGWRSLRAAMDEVAASGAEPDRKRAPAPFPSTAPLRAAGHDGSPDRPIDRLERAVLNLIGCPVVPAGPGDPEDFRIAAGPVAAEVADAIETLATDNPVRVAAAIHLLSIDAPGRRGDPNRAKALRSGQRLLAGARKRASGAELAPALAVMVASFGTELEADEIEVLLDEHTACRQGPATSLLWARYGYPALVSAGRVDGARRKVETAMLAAEATGDPLQQAEARLLWTRHLLWAGQLEAAEQSIAETADALGSLGLAVPLPVLRQRRILRSLRGQSGDDPAEEGTMERATGSVAAGDRATPSELAFRLAHLGQREQASEHISQMASPERVAAIDVAELALLGAAANLVGHQPAARFFHQQLNESNDSLIVRHDGSAILGPIELWSSFAAKGAGRKREARRLLDASLEAIRRHGGGVPVQMLFPTGPPDGVPIESQPNLKSARAH